MRQLPGSEGAPQVAQKAPEFTLPDQNGHNVSLKQLLSRAATGTIKPTAALLIFYRGHW
jgi:peroxiredoxin